MPSEMNTTEPRLLEVEGLRKQFRLYDRPSDRLREALLGGIYHRTHTALEAISFCINPGEAVGIIGRNGAGKSTLLKLVTGILVPDAGVISSTGRITGLLELGTGFDMTLSGRQNIRINGQLIGMEPELIDRNQQAIIAFAELGDYIDAPVRTYSSGMVMRLGYAIAAFAEPSCLVVDEALAVGDARFQQKCIRHIRDFRDNGGGVLFVSHDLNAVKVVCNRALVLEGGRILCDADPDTAVRVYYRAITDLDDSQIDIKSPHLPGSYGKRQIEIVAATLTSGKDQHPGPFGSGEKVCLQANIESRIAGNYHVGILIRDRFGQDIFGTNTALLGQHIHFKQNGSHKIKFYFPLTFAPGAYTITLAVHADSTHESDCQHWWDNAIAFEIAGFSGRAFSGVCEIPVEVTAYENTDSHL